MLAKTIDVEVVQNTFPNNAIPPQFACPATMSIDVADALLMLGQLTSPAGFSQASPNRYWTWLRYFSAVASTPDLRITAPFIDLDPHQKTILSDDFGVALTTKWLYDCLGGFSEIVDGRKFLLQFPHLVKRPRRKTPKVGTGKCPDYVVRDRANRWHIIECKGTQSGTNYRNRQLQSARFQKNVIQISGASQGERLAAGIYLGNERGDVNSHLKVIDPDPKPLLVLRDQEAPTANLVVDKMAVSRALALAGFDELAARLELPTQRADEFEEFYTSEERRSFQQPREEVVGAAFKSLRDIKLTHFQIEGEMYVGQRVELRIPGDDFRRNTGCTTVRVSQGVNSEWLEEALSIESDHERTLMEQSEPFLYDPSIQFRTDGLTTTLHESRLSAAKMEFLD
ncbi:MAG TPA: hypothetical protein VLC71_13000 [Thermomonas sp.]|nr:hypothetical protein [Thermomonas sp.]